MARSKPKRGDRNKVDRGYSTPSPNVQLNTAALGTPASQVALTFVQPMLITDSGIPSGITAGTLSPTSVVSVGPNGVTLGFASVIGTGTVLNVLSSVPNYRTPAGGYLLPTRRTL
jgi:hypothetical protein